MDRNYETKHIEGIDDAEHKGANFQIEYKDCPEPLQSMSVSRAEYKQLAEVRARYSKSIEEAERKRRDDARRRSYEIKSASAARVPQVETPPSSPPDANDINWLKYLAGKEGRAWAFGQVMMKHRRYGDLVNAFTIKQALKDFLVMYKGWKLQ